MTSFVINGKFQYNHLIELHLIFYKLIALAYIILMYNFYILIWLDADYIQELLIYNIQGKI
jgi:hypothetical protein